jgi:hypothetical protein
MGQPAIVFERVVEALEAETLTGQTAMRVVSATKALLQATSTDPSPMLLKFSPETQNLVRRFFA